MRAWSPASFAVVLAACLGLVAFIAGLPAATYVLPAWAAWLLAAPPVLLLVAATLDSAGAAAGAERALRARLVAGSRIAWRRGPIAHCPSRRSFRPARAAAGVRSPSIRSLAWRWPSEGERRHATRAHDAAWRGRRSRSSARSRCVPRVGARAGAARSSTDTLLGRRATHRADGHSRSRSSGTSVTAGEPRPAAVRCGALTSLVLVPVMWFTGGSYHAALIALTIFPCSRCLDSSD